MILATKNVRCQSRIVRMTDKYSYEIYLVHAVVLEGIGMIGAQIFIPVWGIAALAAGLTAAGAAVERRGKNGF